MTVAETGRPAAPGLDTKLAPALDALRAGFPVVVDSSGPDGTRYEVVLAAATVTTRWAAWTVRHTSGLLCAPLSDDRADALDLPLMTRSAPRAVSGTTVSVDAAHGVGTGISAADRARTARVLADPDSRPTDLTRPGHVLPVRTDPRGVLGDPRPAEAAVDLCRLAGIAPVALGAVPVAGLGLAGLQEVAALVTRHGIVTVTVDDLVRHRLRCGDGTLGRVVRGASARIAVRGGPVTAIGYHDTVTGADHVVLVGDHGPAAPIVRLHAGCAFGALPGVAGTPPCRCGRRLADAAGLTAREGGVLVNLGRPPLGSGGRAAEVHGTGCADTPDSTDGTSRTAAGRDPRDWLLDDDGAAAAILADLGRSAVRLAQGPTTAARLAGPGLTVVDLASPVPTPAPALEIP